MDYLTQAEQLIRDIETLPLSQILPRMLPIALTCADYKGYCVLSHIILPITENLQANSVQSNEIIKVLLLQGLSNEDIATTLQKSREEAIKLKALSEGQISSHSIREIEDWLLEAKTKLDSITYVTNTAYQDLATRIAQMRRLYETLRGYAVSKLTYYQQVLKNKSSVPPKHQSKKTRIFNMEKVFIVHGRNGELKEAVARLIEKQGIQAIILHEQANEGATIIEKFERNSDVGCAVCLFTSDDFGRAKTDSTDNPRARQNVVFEAGYFIGKLGRSRVIIIADKDVEIPSDLQGIVYAETASWRYSVLRELKTIGYNIDYNKLD